MFLSLKLSKGRDHNDALFLLLTISRADSPTAVPGVEVIDQSLESNDKIVRLIEGVDISRGGEHPDIVLPQIVNEQSSLGAVPPQTGEVFHHDGLDPPGASAPTDPGSRWHRWRRGLVEPSAGYR